jgi:TPR repeat protein
MLRHTLAASLLLFIPSFASAQSDARESALAAFSMEFYRDQVAASPAQLAEKFQGACDQGYAPACQRKNWFIDGAASLQKAQEVLAPSCDAGDPVACMVTGWAFEAAAAATKLPDERDRLQKRAARNYKIHCDAGFVEACDDYASMLYQYPSLGAEPRAAVKRWQDACLAGVGGACDSLAKLHLNGGPAIKPNRRAALDYANRSCTAGYAAGCATLGAMEDGAWSVDKLDSLYGDICEDGHRDSCWKLARSYFDGVHDEPTEGRAQALFASACDLGHANACYEAGRHYGDGQATDDVKAAEYYRRACDLGAPAACAAVVDMMLSGRSAGTVKDSLPAFTVACEQRDSATACSVLGQALIEGADVPRDAERGRRLLMRACKDESSDPQACAQLARACEEGWGGDRDRTEASRYYRWSCLSGQLDSCARRGDLLTSDVGVRRDDLEALAMYERACAAPAGSMFAATSCRKAGTIVQEGTFVPRDLPRAQTYFKSACDQGDAQGCLGLGQVLNEGVNGSPDPAGARSAFESAIAAGSLDAKRQLAKLLWTGAGGSKDKGRAKKLAKEACQAGDPIACRGPAFL